MKNSIRINRALAAKTKQILFVAALALTFAACNTKNEAEDKSVATFEEAAISPLVKESEFVYRVDTTVYLESGNFQLQQTVAYGATSIAGAVVSNRTDTKFETLVDAYRSMAPGAFAGKNYVVWYHNAWSPCVIKLKTPATVAGMYVCNNNYAYNSMTKGDAYAGEPFGDDDWLKLTITGSLNGTDVNNKVEFSLAEGKKIVTDWTYVDLSKLGKIDEIHFDMTGSRTGQWGLNTPSYFCIDNLGAKK